MNLTVLLLFSRHCHHRREIRRERLAHQTHVQRNGGGPRPRRNRLVQERRQAGNKLREANIHTEARLLDDKDNFKHSRNQEGKDGRRRNVYMSDV